MNVFFDPLEPRRLLTVAFDETFAGSRAFPFRSDESITQIQALPEGGVLAVGNTRRVNGIARNDLLFVRLREDGTRDTTFGRVVRGLAGRLANISINTDGSVLVATRNEAEVTLARFTSRGGIERSFSGDGKLVLDLGNNVTRVQADLTGDGAVTVFYKEPGYLNAARYFADGRRDRGFFGGGKLRLSDFDSGAGDPDSPSRQSYSAGNRGTVLVGGDAPVGGISLRQSYATLYSRSGQPQFLETIQEDDSDVELTAVRDDGEPFYAVSLFGGDSSIGSRTLASRNYALPGVGFEVYVRGVEFGPNGEAYFWAMHQNDLDQGSDDVFLTRLKPDGSLDEDYGNSGFVSFDPIESTSPGAYVSSAPFAMTVDRQGRPIILTRTTIDSLETLSIIRLQPEQPPPQSVRISRTGTLLLQGTAEDDRIEITANFDADAGSTVLVRLGSDAVRVERNAFRRVFIDADDGNDSVTVSVPGLRGTVFGSAGDDLIDVVGDRWNVVD